MQPLVGRDMDCNAFQEADLQWLEIAGTIYVDNNLVPWLTLVGLVYYAGKPVEKWI